MLSDMLAQWQKTATHPITDDQTSRFIFDQRYSHRPVFIALAIFFAAARLAPHIKKMDFYRYLSQHSNLGSVTVIKTQLCRARKWLHETNYYAQSFDLSK